MKKRILCILLSVVMLLSLASLFSSCTAKVDLGEYSIVYAKDASTTLIKGANALAEGIRAATGKTVTVTPEGSTDAADKKTPEILIGTTQRDETLKAQKKIKGHGYFIGKVGNKIVLTGSTNFFALQALEAFLADYLGEGADGSVKIAKRVEDEVEVFNLTSAYTMVVSHQAFGKGSFSGANPTLDKDNTELYDLARFLATNLQKKNATYLGDMKVVKDTDKPLEKEILIGRTMEREEMTEYLQGLAVNEYGISVSDGKILVGAYNDTMLVLAMERFADMVVDSKCKDENGKRCVAIPASYEKKVTGNADWVLDYPLLTGENVVLSGSADVYDSSLQLYYTGKGVTEATYNTYCQTLEGAGYTVYTQSAAEDNIFRTYVNNEKGITLYVAYTPLKYATAQGVTEFEANIRVISAPLSAVNLLDSDMLNGADYVKKTETMITNVELDGGADENAGSAYIITLEDGTFVVIDGGSGNTALISQRIFNALKDLYSKVHGKTVSKTNKIVISMWYLTHGHGDHYAGFTKFCEDRKDYIDLKRVVTNFPGDYEVFNACDINLNIRDSFMKKLTAFFPDIKYYKVHTGQKFWLANSMFEVLYTHEDEYPYAAAYYNDSGVVLRQYINANSAAIGDTVTPEATATATTMLWLGDVQNRPSSWMRATWGSYLESDMVQVSHHGAMGCEWKFYELAGGAGGPEILWWPTYRSNYNNCIKTNNDDYRKHVNAKLAKVGFADWIILGSAANTTVTVTKNGPDMSVTGSGSGLYNAGSGYYSAGQTVPDILDKRN